MKFWAFFLFLPIIACSDPRGRPLPDAGVTDVSFFDANRRDSSIMDGASFDGGLDASLSADAVLAQHDGGRRDGAGRDGAGRDGAGRDGDVGRDTGGVDAMSSDALSADTGPRDVGVDAVTDSGNDAGPSSGGCISGATGTHVVRFTWQGNGSGSTAYVSYDANTLPDTSLWRVSAGSGSIGYRPVFSDIFLGEGGLDMGSGVFVDVQLSTLGLSAVTGLTLSVYGRSFNTTSSGSFTWQSFEGTGASPRGGVSNSAPYEWYAAEATGAIVAGDGGIRLRLRAGPPSGRLVVRRVELCFNAR